jgi:hypothetical protein
MPGVAAYLATAGDGRVRLEAADVWLWRPGTRPHWVVVDHGQSLWELDPSKERAYLLLGAAHDRPPRWSTGEDLHLYAQH